jgi:RNA polymerase sigma-32 factor
MGYRGYGLPISKMISEGNIGLIQAVNRFEPEKGFRLATYALCGGSGLRSRNTFCAPGCW